jgi:hypothetical protein
MRGIKILTKNKATNILTKIITVASSSLGLN